jgi:hypothetical protein
MADEFKHKDPCTTLTQAEFIGACGDGHVFACQATGDLLYADSSTVLKRLARACSGSQMLQIASCKPAWTATPSLGSTSWANMNHAHDASNSGGTVNANCLGGTTLKSTVVNSSLENVGTLTALQVDYINANASTLTITDSTDTGDLASLAVTTHGATTLTTTDDDAAAAHFTVDADGNITLDSATGIVTIEDGGTEVLRFTESCSGDVTVKLVTNGKDLIFTDNGDAEGFRILDAAAGVNVAGLLTAGSLDVDNVLIDGTTIGHTCDTDLITVGNACLTVKGDVTVGVDGTGHDVKFFGCAAGAYMEWDESANLLEVRGATAAGPGHLKLTTGEATVVACDVLGKIEFQAPAETGADALRISASIAAVAQATFDATNNATDLVFYTGHSEDAAEKFRFTSQGEIGIGGANYGNCGQVLTSGGAGAAPSWACVSGGGVVSGGTDNAILRADGTGGSTSQGSAVTIADTTGDITLPAAGQILTGTGGACNPGLSFRCDDNTGFFRPSSDQLAVSIAATERMRWNGSTAFILDSANGDMGAGITINQDDNDNSAFSLKSSDISHALVSTITGSTNYGEADDYYTIRKNNGGRGGVRFDVFDDGGVSGDDGHVTWWIWYNADASTTHGTAGRGITNFLNRRYGGSCSLQMATTSNTNQFVVNVSTGSGASQAKFIVDAEGDLFADGTLSAYDAYCDAQLVRTMSNVLSDSVGAGEPTIENKWDSFISYNEQTLIDAGLLGGPRVGRDPNVYDCRPREGQGVGLINYTGMVRLHNGAIWQLHSKLNDQAEELTALKGQLTALTEGK